MMGRRAAISDVFRGCYQGNGEVCKALPLFCFHDLLECGEKARQRLREEGYSRIECTRFSETGTAMAKILYVLPLTGIGEYERKKREKLASSFLTNPKNQLVMEAVDEGPLSIESTIEEYWSGVNTLKKIASVQHSYDAVVVGCAMDGGVDAAREISEIPVVGPLESSLHIASMLGDTFSIVTMLSSMVPPTWRKLRGYRADHKCESVIAIDFPVLKVSENKEEAVEVFVREVRRIVDCDKPASVIFGCMAMGFLLFDELAKGKVTVPIINPAKASIKVAEMLVSLELTQSRMSYPQANYEKLKNLIPHDPTPL
jgi:allantoin racemase